MPNYKGLINTLQDRPLCQATHDAALEITTGGTWKEIPLDLANIDNGLMYDATNDRIKVIKAGSYLINANVAWFSGNDAGDRRMKVDQTGAQLFAKINDTPRGNSYDQQALIASTLVDDYFQLFMYQNSGSTIKIVKDGCILDVYKLAEL